MYVVALPHNPVVDRGNQLNRSGYGKTFYPNATELRDAKLVNVTPSGPARADIALAPVRLAIVSGTVIGSSGRPVSGGVLEVAHGDGLFGLDSRGLQIRPDGTFIAPALAPGTYFLQFHESAWPPPRGVIPTVSGAKVTVATADVTHVRVQPIAMVRASGRLVVNPADRSSLQPSALTVGAAPVEYDGNPGPQRPGVPNDDLTFEFKTWPSTGRIRLLPELDWSIKAIRLNGVDMTDKPIEFMQGTEITGLEIEIVKRHSGGRRQAPSRETRELRDVQLLGG
jgi:hypothetical protein